MPRDAQKYLYDILSSCEFLLEFTAGRTVDDYAQDRGFRSAVERELQIIGEAVMQLDRLSRELAARIPEHRDIIGFRHVLVHGYDSLHPATVWNVIEDKLPALVREVRALLAQLDA
jgi:uncharacterized protein with HEPN domain